MRVDPLLLVAALLAGSSCTAETESATRAVPVAPGKEMQLWDGPPPTAPTGAAIARCVGQMDALAEYQAETGDPDGRAYLESNDGERYIALARVVESGMTVEDVARERAIGHDRTAPFIRGVLDDPLDPISRRFVQTSWVCGTITDQLIARGLWRPNEP